MRQNAGRMLHYKLGTVTEVSRDRELVDVLRTAWHVRGTEVAWRASKLPSLHKEPGLR